MKIPNDPGPTYIHQKCYDPYRPDLLPQTSPWLGYSIAKTVIFHDSKIDLNVERPRLSLSVTSTRLATVFHILCFILNAKLNVVAY